MTTLGNLPDEMMLNILPYMSYEDLINYRSINRYAWNLAQDEFVLNLIKRRKNEKILKEHLHELLDGYIFWDTGSISKHGGMYIYHYNNFLDRDSIDRNEALSILDELIDEREILKIYFIGPIPNFWINNGLYEVKHETNGDTTYVLIDPAKFIDNV